jgi:hypothetical protein
VDGGVNVSGDELYEFFARLGEAVYFSQVIEGSLHKILIMKQIAPGTTITQSEADIALEAMRKETLGRLITIAKKEGLLPAELLDQLDRLNAERKWLIHRMREDTDLGFRNDPDVRLKVTSRVIEIAQFASDLNNDLYGWLIADLGPILISSEKVQKSFAANLKSGGFL